MYESIFRRAVRRLILVMRLSTLQPNRRHMNHMLGGWSNRRPWNYNSRLYGDIDFAWVNQSVAERADAWGNNTFDDLTFKYLVDR